MFNCNHYLVSQTNPHIVPLLNLKRGMSGKWGQILEAELKHRCQVSVGKMCDKNPIGNNIHFVPPSTTSLLPPLFPPRSFSGCSPIGFHPDGYLSSLSLGRGT